MKKFWKILVTAITLCSISVTASALVIEPPFATKGASIYMVNMDTGTVVYEKNAHERRAPASITKIMTSLLLLENVQDGSTVMTAPGYIYDEFQGLRVSNADILPGEQVSAESLLHAMLLPSGNEAASIVADNIGQGSIPNFCAKMTARALELGCENTNFTNPHGIFGMERENYSTAYDMFLMAKECWYSKDPYVQSTFREAAAQTEYWMPISNKHATPDEGAPEGKAYPIRTTNAMMRFGTPVYMPEVSGMKTGSTPDAGYNLVSTATRDGQTYLLVVMGTPYETDANGYGLAFSDSQSLYEWAFDSFSVRPALDVKKQVAEVGVKYSDKVDTLMVYPAEGLLTLLPNETDETTIDKKLNIPENISAPIKKGDIVGTVTMSLAGEEIGTVDLISDKDIERNNAMYILAQIGEFFSSLYFKVLFTLCLIAIGIYVGFVYWISVQDKKRRKVNRGDNKFRKR